MKANLLVVEDEPLVAEDLTECLESFGYRVIAVATAGQQAVELAEVFVPDLILMDIRLKGSMNGIDAAVAIRERRDVPIVFLTAFADEGLLEAAQAAMPYGYLVKPFAERELRAALHIALNKHRFDCKTRANQRWLDAILRGMGEGVVVCDAEAQVMFINPAGEHLTGRCSSEAVGEPVARILRFEPTIAGLSVHPLLAAMQTGHIIEIAPSVYLMRKDGSALPVADSCAPIRDSNGEIVGGVCVFRDDTPHRQREQMLLFEERTRRLEEQMAELERLDRMKDEFLSTVSHELRTPLTNMRLVVRLLQARGQTVELKRYLDIMELEVNREIHLVEELLDLQKLSGIMDAPREAVRLQDFLPPLVEPFRLRILEGSCSLTLDIDPDLPSVVAHPPSLQRAIYELFNNACKYTPKGGAIVVSAQPSPDNRERVELRFANTSAPLSNEQLDRIFEKFYRVASDNPNPQGGAGLGLSLVRRWLELSGGGVRATTEGPDRISFIVTLQVVLA